MCQAEKELERTKEVILQLVDSKNACLEKYERLSNVSLDMFRYLCSFYKTIDLDELPSTYVEYMNSYYSSLLDLGVIAE